MNNTHSLTWTDTHGQTQTQQVNTHTVTMVTIKKCVRVGEKGVE